MTSQNLLYLKFVTWRCSLDGFCVRLSSMN